MPDTLLPARLGYNRREQCGEHQMTREDRLADLLERWESAISDGRRPSPEEFCQDTPEDLPAFLSLLKQLGAAGLVTASGPHVLQSSSSNFRAGRYTAFDYHAEGGLGVVYRARDEELNRTVALKCMKASGTATSPIGQRFLLEAEITSQLDHPGIAPVHGRGQMDDGRPFYAMRFIEGETLQDASRRYHGEASSVELRRLLRAFVGVCETMAYAHSRHVIHRDLKPSNVMVGQFGEVLVMDWGLGKELSTTENLESIAKEATRSETENSAQVGEAGSSTQMAEHSPGDTPQMLAETPVGNSGTPHVDFTVYGRAKGSPSFMSPEQARGEWDRVGPASDIYSLGSTLYYLLTGRVPYEGKTSGEVVERVCAGDFPAPRSLKSNVAPALDAICRKAMAFNPADRYSTARALAEDVERWLADEPVAAWSEPISVRARRWMKRHRTLVTAGAAVVVVGVVLMAINGYRLDRKNDELQAQRDRAEDRFQSALESNSQLVTDIQTKLIRSPGTRAVRESLLREAIARLEKLLQDADQTRDVNRITLKARLQLGDLFGDVEQSPSKALLEYQRALALANELRELHPDDSDIRLDTVETLRRIGRAHTELGQHALAAENYRAASRILEGTGNEGDFSRANILKGEADLQLEIGDAPSARNSLLQARRFLERNDPENKDEHTRVAIAETLSALGQADFRAGKYSLAIGHFSEALKKWSELESARPQDVTIQRKVALTHNGLASTHRELGQLTDASAHAHLFFQRAKLLADQDAENGEAVLLLAFAHGELAMDHGQRFELKRALEHFSQFHRLVQKLSELDRNSLVGRRNHALGLSKLAAMAVNLRQHQAAVAHYTEAIAICRRILASAPDRTQVRADLADYLRELGLIYLQYLPEKEPGLSALIDSLSTWQMLLENHPTNVAWKRSGMEAHRLMAYWQRTLNKDFDGAALQVKTGLARAEKFTAEDRAIPLVRKTIGLLQIESAAIDFGRSQREQAIQHVAGEIKRLADSVQDSITLNLIVRNHKLLYEEYRSLRLFDEANKALKGTIDAARAGLEVDREGVELRAYLQLHLAIEADRVMNKNPAAALKLLDEALAHSPRFPADLAEHALQRQRFAAIESRAGDCSEMLNRPKDALAHYERALEHHEHLAKSEEAGLGLPGIVAYDRRRMAEIRLYLLDFKGSLKDYRAAKKILDQMQADKKPLQFVDQTTQRLLKDNLPFVESLPMGIETLDAATKQPTSVRMNALRIRIAWLIKADRMAEAIATANRMAEQKSLGGDAFALAAVEFGRLAIAHEEKSREHASRALELLFRAKAAGYFGGSDDIAWLEWEPFFEKVRLDPGYRKLVQALEKK